MYYLQRSQPPLLTLMMDRYVAHTNDTTFLRWAALPVLPCTPLPETPRGGAGAGLGRGCCRAAAGRLDGESARLHPRDHIETLASELDFWTKNKSISVSAGGKSYSLNRYEVPYGGPR